MPLIRYRVAGGAWVEANVTLPFDITAETTEDVEVQGLGTIAIDEGVAAAQQPYVVIAVAGQSNGTGKYPVVDTIYDVTRTGVEQYANNSNAAGFETITTDTAPLLHPVLVAQGTDRHGAGAPFAARIIANNYVPAGHRVLLVPCARPATGLADASEPWWAGSTEGVLFANMVAQTNKAIVAAKAINTNSYFGGWVWVQGEADAGANRSTATYASAFTELINKGRSQITGATNAPFVIGSMTPEIVASGANYQAIQAAHIQVANTLPRVYFHQAATGLSQPGDDLHYSAAGQETIGTSMANLLLALTTPAVLSSASGTQTGTTTATLSVSTTRGDGTLYAVATTSATVPSAAQIKAGNDHTGTAATFDASKTVTASGANTFSATGLTPATQYYAHFYHETGNPAQASNIISSTGFTTASTGGVDPAAMAAAYIAAMSTAPSTAEQTKIEARFDDLNTAGVLAKLDAMWALDAHTEQAARLNMIDPAGFTLTGAFTHTAGSKATGNGTNVVTTGFNFSTSGTNYTDSGASIGIDVTDTPAAGMVMGTNSSTTVIVNPQTPAGNLAIRIGNILNANAGGTTGFFAGTHNGVDTATSYRNGTVVTTAGLGTDDITPADTLVIFGGNGSPSSHGARFAFVGGHLTQADVQAIQTAFAVA